MKFTTRETVILESTEGALHVSDSFMFAPGDNGVILMFHNTTKSNGDFIMRAYVELDPDTAMGLYDALLCRAQH